MIFTFYSYKGGVGRSMALAGVAYVLAQRGLRVLVVDFDLEAPGLERYFFDGEHSRRVRAQPGLMDLIQAYRRALSSKSAFEEAEFMQWERFRQTAIPNAAPPRGLVDLMAAGQREPEDKLRSYALDVRSFDWQDFFHNWKGDLFFDWLRRQLTAPERGYDVVLVDSRTGVTEMGGVCAYQLADAVVLLCAPNYQNLEGTRDVARDFRSDGVLGLRQGRPLELLAVPARLEANHPNRREFLDAFRRELGVDGLPKVLAEAGLDYENLALPYLPEYAVVERLVGEAGAGHGAGAPRLQVFERLADALCLLAPPATALGQLRTLAMARLRGAQTPAQPDLVADPTRSSAGFDAYIDISMANEPLGRALQQALSAAGLNVYLCISDQVPLPPSAEAALDYSSALVPCFGEPASGEWRSRLIARARRLQRVRLVPVLLPGASPQALASFDLTEKQALDLRGQEGDIRAMAARLLPLLRSTPTQAAPVTPERDPYPGAAPYREDDAEGFAGRDTELGQLHEALAQHDVVLLSGPAQVGKTSLLAAGLVPRLRTGTSPAQDATPEAANAAALRCGALVWYEAATLPDEPPARSKPADAAALPTVVVIDHIDTLDDEGQAEERLRHIGTWLRRAGPGLKFVLCWRDVLAPAQRAHALAGWNAHTVELSPLQGPALRAAIEAPARRAGHLLEPGLTERLIESAGTADNAIAQIQYALHALWPERRRGWLTNKALDALGHLGGLFQQRLSTLRAELAPAQRHAVEVLFQSLVVLDSRLRYVSAPQDWETLASIPAIAQAGGRALRDRLASAGLVDLRREVQPRDGCQVRLALVRPDPAAYFPENAQPDLGFLMWRREIYSPVQRWRADGESPDALLRGGPLADAEQWLALRPDELTAAECDFINRSVQSREEEVQRERERESQRLKVAEQLAEARRLANEQLELVNTQLEAVAAERQQANVRLKRQRLGLLGLVLFAVGMSGTAYWQSELKQDAVQQVQTSTVLQNAVVSDAASVSPAVRERRANTVVEYYARPADGEAVNAALLGLGFNVRRQQPKNNSTSLNAIWFGSAANLDDIKLVATTLIRAGSRIQVVVPIPRNLSNKDQALIQVGATSEPVSTPPYTVEEVQRVQSLSGFPR